MVEFTLTERTEPFTLKEVLDFIDDTNIGKRDAHELKSRIVDVVLDAEDRVIDEFANRLKERLKGMQMAELQGEDVCPCGEDTLVCYYMNSDVGCQYCAREQTIKDIDEIAEQMKKGV